MLIELNKIGDNKLFIDEYVAFDESMLTTSGIKELKAIKFVGEVYYNSLDELVINGVINGVMVLEDAISLEDVDLPINIEFEQIVDKTDENKQNLLDIRDVLWQNIVLEVPIRITKSKSTSQKGEGWELKDENEKKIDSRMAPLMSLLDEEKEK